ncbi:rhomboid family intramembrane serine protease [Phormidium sp. CLA17]|uniref:rhomboid family intramembrane serine protease n=1 Tax=Leptolyngbya sp. Cla-17 TaxID=2803751 RepID=UPI0014921FDC|nr:rhomboid family intramembrane serine protease [Leptolyngbya sp. Cla-17]MBM0742701.1 rhomboid family intramembrane serine protease [Leptolyngbya sp. Cla-17]
MTRDGDKQSVFKEITTQLVILGGLVLLAWGVELFDLFVLRGGSLYGGFSQCRTDLRGGSQCGLDQFGIIPRNLIGLRGILFAPFLHANLAHLIGNTIPFITLGWLIMLREISDFFVVSVISAVVGGFGTWLLGSSGIHIGASGVIFGYLGYLLSRGYFERKPLSIAMSLFVLVLYGSLIWGLLPFQYGISWEGHLFGFFGGVVSAKLLARDGKSVRG